MQSRDNRSISSTSALTGDSQHFSREEMIRTHSLYAPNPAVNRPFRRLYTDPTPRRPSAISMMSMLSDVSPINTPVSCPIARGWSLVPHQFRGLVSHISPLKHYSKLVSTVRKQSTRRHRYDRNGMMESPVGCFHRTTVRPPSRHYRYLAI